MSLTIFAIPKPFRGPFEIIQRNALQSWLALRPQPEILLFGDESGTAEWAATFGVRHEPTIARRDDGAPTLSLFEQAQRLASHDVLCYVNADVMLLSDFMGALRWLETMAPPFLLVGRVWRVRLDQPWDFHATDWEEGLRSHVRRHGAQAAPPGNSDYFVFPRGQWRELPPLAIGRGAWDAWLVYQARRQGAQVIDASAVIMAIHQNHDQAAYQYGLRRWRAELDRNASITGRDAARFSLLDATHVVTETGLRRSRGMRYLIRKIDTYPLWHPRLAWLMWMPRLLVSALRWIRDRALQRRNPGYRLHRTLLADVTHTAITSIVGLSSIGFELARWRLGGGYPVILYDPDPKRLAEGQRLLSGPLVVVDSVEACVEQGDVVVVTTSDPLLRARACERVSSNGRVRPLIVDGRWRASPRDG